jgi:predicted PurR-regulated permease PerM
MPMIADSARGLAAALTIAALIIAALVLGREVLIPFALATILAFILAPFVRFLSARRVPRGGAVALVLATLVGVLVLGSVVFSAQLLSLTASLAGYKDNLVQKIRVVTGARSGEGVIKKAADSVDLLEKEFKKETSPGSTTGPAPPVVLTREQGSSAGTLFEQVRNILGPLAGTGLTLLFAGFLLAQYHDIRDRVVRLAGTDNMTATTSALSEAGSRLSRLFLMQAALNASFGTIVAIALAVIGVPNPILWGVATTFLRFVPYIGSFLAAVPPLLLAAAVDPGWTMVLATLALFLIGEPLVGHVIEPHVLGSGVGLSPTAMIAAASFWTLVWGPIGLILAAPLTMSIVVLGGYIPRLEFMSVLLGDAPALAPEHELYHRLLSDDAAIAAEQIEQAIVSTSAGATADEIILPALRIAARDHRSERLDTEQITALRETMKSVVDLVVDELQGPSASDAPAVAEAAADSGQVIVIPARGPIDSIAASFIAALLGTAVGRKCVAVEHASGLMGLSAARSLARGLAVDSVILSTVGGVEDQHLRLLVKRVQSAFPDVRLLICDWGAEQKNATPAAQSAPSHEAYAGKLSTVIEMLTFDRPAETVDAVRAASSTDDTSLPATFAAA